jgi:sterol 3beta-glucosyltransferase
MASCSGKRMMVLCNDTRGGVQPYVALAAGLASAGHDVCAVAPANLSYLFEQAGVRVRRLSGTAEADLGQMTSVGERGSLAAIRFMANELPKHILAWTRETLAACEGADRLIGGVGGMVIGQSVAEKLGIPFTEAHLQPVGVRTNKFPGVMLPHAPSWLGGSAIRISHQLSDAAVWLPFKRAMKMARRDALGMVGKPRVASLQPVLYGFSRHVLDVTACNGTARYATGYWARATDPAWVSPPGLEAFLTGEKPVVSIGFGSMASHDPEAAISLVRGAVHHAGVKAVILSGWHGLATGQDSDTLFFAKELPHDWLFPRVSAIVHHGGAGTTGAALMAGIPSVIVPFAMDQPFWGKRVADLGVGPQPIPRGKLTSDALALSLQSCLNDPAMRENATVLGQRLRAEDGVSAAIKIIMEC